MDQAKDSPQDHLAWTARRTAPPCARTRNIATTTSRLTRFSLYDAERLVDGGRLVKFPYIHCLAYYLFYLPAPKYINPSVWPR
jgi:hypothetical protein